MKKLMIVLVALMAVISSAYAFGERKTYVIKDGDKVTVFHIKDVSKDSYSWKEYQITTYSSTKLTAGDLESLEIPEGAWKLCTSSESGAYSTEEAELAAKNKELKDDNDYLEEENRDLQSSKSDLGLLVVCLFGISILLLILSLTYRSNLKKEKAR
jgi:hypothetical protein